MILLHLSRINNLKFKIFKKNKKNMKIKLQKKINLIQFLKFLKPVKLYRHKQEIEILKEIMI